jgi:hypothetical protein
MREPIWTEVAWLRPLWLGVLVTASAALTTVFTCITPFVAFAVIVATTLSRRQALSCTVTAWLANQVVGFGVLNYPWTTTTFFWGVAIGGAAVTATLVAQWTVRWLASFRSALQALVGFAAAFAGYQVGLYAVALSLLGGTDAFAPRFIGQVLLVNVVALVGLFALHRVIAVTAVTARRGRARVSPAHLA